MDEKEKEINGLKMVWFVNGAVLTGVTIWLLFLLISSYQSDRAGAVNQTYGLHDCVKTTRYVIDEHSGQLSMPEDVKCIK